METYSDWDVFVMIKSEKVIYLLLWVLHIKNYMSWCNINKINYFHILFLWDKLLSVYREVAYLCIDVVI